MSFSRKTGVGLLLGIEGGSDVHTLHPLTPQALGGGEGNGSNVG